MCKLGGAYSLLLAQASKLYPVTATQPGIKPQVGMSYLICRECTPEVCKGFVNFQGYQFLSYFLYRDSMSQVVYTSTCLMGEVTYCDVQVPGIAMQCFPQLHHCQHVYYKREEKRVTPQRRS